MVQEPRNVMDKQSDCGVREAGHLFGEQTLHQGNVKHGATVARDGFEEFGRNAEVCEVSDVAGFATSAAVAGSGSVRSRIE